MLNKEYEAGVEDHQGRKLSMYEKHGMREVTGKNNPDGRHDEVNVVRERGNMRQVQSEQLLKILGCKSIAAEHDLKRSAREVRFDEDTVGHVDDDDKEKIAEKHLYKMPEKRDVMTDINYKGKYDEDVNVGKMDNRVDENNAEKLSSQSRRPFMGEPVSKSFGNAASRIFSIRTPAKTRFTRSLRRGL
jgi:hypothetical protein